MTRHLYDVTVSAHSSGESSRFPEPTDEVSRYLRAMDDADLDEVWAGITFGGTADPTDSP